MDWKQRLQHGVVIPAHPLALNASRKLDERRQRALTRYYCEAGAGGIAVGVHTTQFEIRDCGLYRPVLELARETVDDRDVIRIAGLCGFTRQAVNEAETATALGYHAGLLSLAALRTASDDELIQHAEAVGEVIPLFGFYLQPAVGGRILPYSFWRRFVELESVVAIKVAPFNRYQTIEVIRALAESGRTGDVALYTGNDDHIVLDLLSPWFAGGLLGHWAVWTRRAVETLDHLRAAKLARTISPDLFALADQTTDANAAIFDAANAFHGCIPGIHEILRRQGLLEGRWCLNEHEELSPGQIEEIDRVYRMYPWLADDDFVQANLDKWLS